MLVLLLFVQAFLMRPLQISKINFFPFIRGILSEMARFLYPDGGAHLPNPNAEDINGMALIDSIGFTSWGFDIARGRPPGLK